jgi:hypothetical protein
MMAAAGNLDILLRKPKKSRRKVNLKKYIDRQLKRRVLKLSDGNRAPHEISRASFRAGFSDDENSKIFGWDWLLDEDNEDDDRESLLTLNAHTKTVAICGTRNQNAKTGLRLKIPASWKAQSARVRGRRAHHGKSRARKQQKTIEELSELAMRTTLEDNLLDLLDTIGGDISDNSDSGYSLSEGLPDSGHSPATEPAKAITTYSSYARNTAAAPCQMTYVTCNPLPEPVPGDQMAIHMQQPQPSSGDQMAMRMQQQVWQGYDDPSFPQPAAAPQDLQAVQLDCIPTEQLLPSTATASYYRC